jgi:multidrug efflux pump subunit AcrB
MSEALYQEFWIIFLKVQSNQKFSNRVQVCELQCGYLSTLKTMSDLELTDYADRYLTDTFSTVDGVGRVRLGGQRELSLRIWLDPIALAARDLTTQEVENVLRRENS